MKVPEIDPKNWQGFEKFLPFVIFAVALAIRLCYDLVISEQRLCSFGDGYFFLKTGQELAKAITSASGFPDFLAKLTVHTSEVAGGVATFGSGALADRLLLDGPVYTCFLAIVHILAGIVGTTDYAQNSPILSVANSIVDAFSCALVYICGRFAFSSKAGLVAALLLAVYPASVLNTRLCYAELFTYFLMLFWSAVALWLFRQPDGEAKRYSLTDSAAFLLLGLLTVVIVLARSVFLPLPLIGMAVLFFRKKITFRVPHIAAFFAGATIVMAPWLWFTHEVTGKFMPWVNRAPGYNLFVGNQLKTDGWRTWPAQPGIPNETSDAMKSISTNFSSDPVRFGALFMRKVSRLWGGVWSDFQHKFFGIFWQVQNIFHNLILLFAFLGLFTAVRKGAWRPAAVLYIFAAFHSVYACFEPVARYAITAMPFACLLAAEGLVNVPKLLRNVNFWSLIVYGALFFALLDYHFSFIPALFAILPTDMMPPIALLDAAIWCAGWLLLAVLFAKLIAPAKWWENAVVWIAAVKLMTVSLCGLAFDPARSEWYTELRASGDAVHAEISAVVPDSARSPVSYLLVDMQTEMPSPAVRVLLNDQPTLPPIPVLQFMKDRKDASEIFSLQAQAMGIDPRSYRHWWVFPLPTKNLSPSQPNKISISANVDETSSYQPVKIFGAYFSSQEELDLSRNAGAPAVSDTTIPSINKFSWVKGFVTIDRRDPRPYETMQVKGAVRNCSFESAGTSGTSDLSQSFGRQFGCYRMRLYVPPAVMSSDSTGDQPVTVFERQDEIVIAGGDPSTMVINQTPIRFPETTSNSPYYLVSCELKRVKSKSIGAVSVRFTKNQESWSSPWTPTTLKLESDQWQKFTFIDLIPEDFRKSDVTASIIASPFPADRLFLHQKEALRDTVKIRRVEIKYFDNYAPNFASVEPEHLF